MGKDLQVMTQPQSLYELRILSRVVSLCTTAKIVVVQKNE
jgi:hypothetical protein